MVKNTLNELGIHVLTIRLGYASIQMPQTVTKDMIESRLNKYGFELLEDKEEVMMEQIKLGIQHYIEKLETSTTEVMLSDFLAQEIGKNYNFLSKLFSRSKGITIEAYYINKRVDRVKELIKYDELNLSEIAVKLGYSSVHYLSSQFKRVTGFSVSDYKEVIRNENRYYKNIAEALSDLREKGYTYNFDKKNGCLECKDLCASFQIEDLHISEFYRFKEYEDAAGNSIIYGIETSDGLKGLFIDSNNLVNERLSKKLSSKSNTKKTD